MILILQFHMSLTEKDGFISTSYILGEKGELHETHLYLFLNILFISLNTVLCLQLNVSFKRTIQHFSIYLIKNLFIHSISIFLFIFPSSFSPFTHFSIILPFLNPSTFPSIGSFISLISNHLFIPQFPHTPIYFFTIYPFIYFLFNYFLFLSSTLYSSLYVLFLSPFHSPT